MRTRARLASFAALSIAALTVTTGHAASASAASASSPTGHYVYVQTNDPDGNHVVVYQRTADGGLERSGTYGTGGRGGALAGAVADRLASQGAVTFDPRTRQLYTVNAGSNSLTVFRTDGARLIRRQVLRTGGIFPVSVTVHGSYVYVLNAREGGSVQGFRWQYGTLRRIAGWHIDLGLDDTGQPEFTHTPGHILFSPDGSKLIVTTKAASNSIEVFSVTPDGRPHRTPRIAVFANQVPFAGSFDPFGRLAVVFAGTSSVGLYDVQGDGSLSEVAVRTTEQRASCWIVGIGRTLYVSNAASATVSRLATTRDGILHRYENTSTDAGTVDAAASSDGHYLYVETGIGGIVDVFHVNRDRTLSPRGSVTVPDTIGGEGLAAS